MGVRFDRLRYEVFQNLFLSPMNTGSVRPAVATTPTARGMRRDGHGYYNSKELTKLQQHLPLAVCAEGCETAEEQSDDEVRTSQVPERSEGKTKAISNSTYRLRY